MRASRKSKFPTPLSDLIHQARLALDKLPKAERYELMANFLQEHAHEEDHLAEQVLRDSGHTLGEPFTTWWLDHGKRADSLRDTLEHVEFQTMCEREKQEKMKKTKGNPDG